MTITRNTAVGVALLLAVAIGALALTDLRLEAGLSDHGDQVEAWLALGVTPRVAVRPIARQAIHAALVPALDQTRTVGLVTVLAHRLGAPRDLPPPA
ncbi:ABC transporter permease [Demequina sp. NBRC 110054]|uniref:ABC transporter permease n=1 Tax=Demequina sp. NBRC 110054 TaxID=1570343 RepID=UPI000A01449B|nr:ABC transporter permease [Demequina sp. NBRC 110054]